jgi:putative acyl-CoA dehydrogenase
MTTTAEGDQQIRDYVCAAPGYATHEVLNQAGALTNYNAYIDDTALVEAVKVFGADWAGETLRRAGTHVGSEKVQCLARQANRHLPELRTHDRFGNRVDVVEFHPAYHELMRLIYGDETHSFAWTHQGEAGAQVARGALSYMWNQGENGICCPMGMTFASIPALRHDKQLYDEWAFHILRPAYDDRPIYAKQKRAATVGMAMTEKQGGSDLRATITTARPASNRRGSGAPYLITGHKWFFSVPMSDLFLTLAQTEKGLSCFVATGWLPDGSRNRLKIQRLKDKCGNKSNASSEIEFHDLYATMLGDEGRGIPTIIEMAHVTRLDFAIGSSGLMRQALSQAIHHTTKRRAFQRSLVDLPIMRNVVADLAVESEAMMWMSMRLASALDREHADRAEGLISRICTPVAKYWACKRAPQFVVEALECHGGNGFIADHLMERLYREAPLNGIWEGTGNVICLDVLRSMRREPETVGAFLAEIRKARGGDARLDAFTDEVERRLSNLSEFEPVARRVIEMMAFALQGSLLVQYSTSAVADAFCATRLDGDWGKAFGTMPKGLDTQAIIDRARIPAG